MVCGQSSPSPSHRPTDSELIIVELGGAHELKVILTHAHFNP